MSSAYREALLNDPDVAATLVDLPERRGRPLLREYSPETALMTAMVDRLTEVVHGIARLGGAKGGKPEQLLRPETAVDELRRLRARTSFQSLLDDVAAAQERWALEHPDEHPDEQPDTTSQTDQQPGGDP